MTTPKTARSASIDLYRTMLMFGICLLHSIHHGIDDCRYLTHSLLFCVDGFVFISGWFGIRFSWKKILGLYGTATYAALLCALHPTTIAGLGLSDYLKTALSLWKDFWFLHAYVLMMMFAPCINITVDYIDKRQLTSTVLPLLIVPFVWSFSTDIPLLRRFTPSTSGLGAYSGITFIGIYTVARLIKRFEHIHFGNLQMLIPAILLLWPICAFGYGRYHSPFALLLSACWFFVFKRTAFPHMLERLVMFTLPSLFSVYLLHAHSRVGFVLIKQLEETIFENLAHSIPIAIRMSILWLTTAAIVFVVCLFIDMPRRLILFGISKTIRNQRDMAK